MAELNQEYQVTRDFILEIKYIFLRFLQAFYSLHPKYKWDPDIRTTKILILDKNAIDIGTETTIPAIIVNRNTLAWSYATGNQNSINSLNKEFKTIFNKPPYAAINPKTYTDLLAGNITIYVMSKNGIETEKIAQEIFTILTGYKDAFKKSGIHKISNLSISSEHPIRTTSEYEVLSTTVSFNIYYQLTIDREYIYNSIQIYYNGQVLSEGVHFNVSIDDNKQIVFNIDIDHNKEDTLKATFIDAVTLNICENIPLIKDEEAGDNIFNLDLTNTECSGIYGYYIVGKNIEIDLDY